VRIAFREIKTLTAVTVIINNVYYDGILDVYNVSIQS